ncbi:MAG: MATE family efflux transporter [Treponema sp.]|jgi:putative MATE family efflux protein|nr:MATE family efflux transporter [Treponema sp.]
MRQINGSFPGRRGDSLNRRDFYTSVIAIGLPVAVQNLLTTSAGMVDTIMIGTLGEQSVAAAGICVQFSMLLFAAWFGFCNGGTIFFAQYWGAGDEKGICRAYGITFSCMMAVALVFSGFAIFAPEFVLAIYTDKEAIRAAAVPYLRIVGWSFPLQIWAAAISSLLRSIEKVKIPLFASIASLVTNFILNWLLIFGHFGFPKMGMAGAAVGTVCAGAVNVLVLYMFCFRDKHSFVLRIRDHFRWNRAFVREYFSRSFFVVCNEALYGTGQFIINIIIGRQSEAGIAAMAVFRVLEGLLFVFFGGLANASAVMVGKKIGAGRHREGYDEGRRFTLLCPAVTLVIWLLLLPFTKPLLGLFGLGSQALHYAFFMILIYTVTGNVRSRNYITNNIFRAGGESIFGTAVEISGLFLLSIPLTALAGFILRWPFLAVFSLTYFDEFIRIGILHWYMKSGRWIKPVTPEGIRRLPAFRAELEKH